MQGMLLQQSAAEQRMVSERCHASLRMRLQIRLQPLFLFRSGPASTHSWRPTIRVQCDDVPGTQVKAVIAFSGRSSSVSPIIEIGFALTGIVFVISRCGPGAILKPAPGCVVALAEFLWRSAFIGQIAGRKYCSR